MIRVQCPPYLGAWGHTLILSEDTTNDLQSHPTEMIPDGVDRSKLESKPDVVFDTFFPPSSQLPHLVNSSAAL